MSRIKKVLVIGGTRYIGRGIVARHIENGDSIELITRGYTPDDFGNAIKRTHLDLMNSSDVAAKFPMEEYDIVYDNMVLCPDHIKERLDRIKCRKYVMVSTAGVYRNYHYDIKEEEFNPAIEEWRYCGYYGVDYDDRKRQAEAALTQEYDDIASVIVRVPVVLGENDYTHRLEWYIDHIIEHKPMSIDNLNYQMPFSYVEDVSEMIYTCGNADFEGAINGSMNGTISVGELIDYIEKKTGKEAIIDGSGEEAPYKSKCSYSLNTDIARALNIKFRNIDFSYDIIDSYLSGRNIN